MSDLLACNVADAALQAYSLGFTPLPLHHHREVSPERRSKAKKPVERDWQNTEYGTSVEVRETFDSTFVGNLGVLLGKPSGGLLDVDLDHPLAVRLAPRFLPPTPARFGRPSKHVSHWLYRAAGEVPRTKRKRDSDGETIAEVRGTGGQTVIPPSVHETGELIEWVGEPWGGPSGPAVVEADDLTVRAGLLSLVVLLAEAWPGEGSRHDAYLALAGGLLRDDDAVGRVSNFWEEAAPEVVVALVEATGDREGSDRREALASTARSLRDGLATITGWPTLADLLRGDGESVVSRVRGCVQDIEGAAGVSRSVAEVEVVGLGQSPVRAEAEDRGESWRKRDLTATVAGLVDGTITRPTPTVARVETGAYLFYEGRVNGLYGDPTAGKTWTALLSCKQVMESGGHVVFIDYEDDEIGAVGRLLDMGVAPGVVLGQFHYVHPDEGFLDNPAAQREVMALLDEVRPRLVVIDSTGESMAYDAIKSNEDENVARWITKFPKAIARRGPGVLLLDHLAKSSDGGLWPIGSQRKRAAITGAAYVQETEVVFSKTQAGFSRLVCSKDRGGNYASKEVVAELHVLPGGETGEVGKVGLGLTAPGSVATGTIRLTEANRVRRRVLWHVHDNPACSSREVGQAVWPSEDSKVAGTRASAALKWLEKAGAVTNTGTRSQAAWSVLPGWENKVPEGFRVRG